MKEEYYKKLKIVLSSIAPISFSISSIYAKKDAKLLEYTSISKSVSNFYVYTLLIIILIHSMSPNLICKLFSNNFYFITTDKGKSIITLLIGGLYLPNTCKALKIFGSLNFTVSFILLLFLMIFKNNKKHVELNNENTKVKDENNTIEIKDKNNAVKDLIEEKEDSPNELREKDDKSMSSILFNDPNQDVNKVCYIDDLKNKNTNNNNNEENN